MSNENTPIAISQESELKVDNGNMNLLGMNIKISDIIGEKIVDQFMATITPEQMESITKVLINEVFEKVLTEEWDDGSSTYKKVESYKFKTTEYTGSGWNAKQESTYLYKECKNIIKEKYSKLIDEKIEEYINSEEYKAKAEEIAKAIIDYATEGYKQDIINSVRERLVLPVVQPYSPEISIRNIVREEIFNAANRNY